jgi:curved DNA-binding protein CbpA
MKKYLVLSLFALCGVINTARRNSVHDDGYHSANQWSRTTSPSSSGRSSRRSSISEDQSLAIVPYLKRNQTPTQKPVIQSHSSGGYQSHYDVLGVPSYATEKEIITARRRVAPTAHSDKGGTQERIQEVNDAHRVLTDSKLRREYNEELPDLRSEYRIEQLHKETTALDQKLPSLKKTLELEQQKIDTKFLNKYSQDLAVKEIFTWHGTTPARYGVTPDGKQAKKQLIEDGFYDKDPETSLGSVKTTQKEIELLENTNKINKSILESERNKQMMQNEYGIRADILAPSAGFKRFNTQRSPLVPTFWKSGNDNRPEPITPDID